LRIPEAFDSKRPWVNAHYLADRLIDIEDSFEDQLVLLLDHFRDINESSPDDVQRLVLNFLPNLFDFIADMFGLQESLLL
jgi:hypothetical protein